MNSPLEIAKRHYTQKLLQIWLKAFLKQRYPVARLDDTGEFYRLSKEYNITIEELTADFISLLSEEIKEAFYNFIECNFYGYFSKEPQ